MKTNASWVLLFSALTVACLAAPQSKRENYESVATVLRRVPEKARARANPLENDSDTAAAGRKLFEEHCAECHGEEATGAKRGPSLRTEELESAKPGEIFWILTNGVVRRGMPSWSKLPEPQRWQISVFLRSLGRP